MTTSIFTYDATGRVTREVLTSLNSHGKQIDKVEAEANKLQVTAIKNYKVLQKAGLEPSDLVSPDKQSNGTCTPEEFAVLICAGAERQWGAKSAKYKQVWRYLHDRDNMTTSQKKTSKTHFKAKYDEFDLAVFTQLLAPAKAYMDQLGKAKPSDKQVSFDSKGNRRTKK
jgi:hypothetical protein